MSFESESVPPRLGGSPAFPTTHWSVILAAGASTNPAHDEALAALCAAYWYPLYAFARRRGLSPEDAMDAVQGFFARLLARRDLRGAEPGKGRFRTFLLTAFRRFLTDGHRRENAEKRGKDLLVSAVVGGEDAEHRFLAEPVNVEDPELLYHRICARDLMSRALRGLEAEYQASGGGEYEVLKGFLPGAESKLTRAEATGRLGLSENAFGVALHRLRRRFREHLVRVIREDCSSPQEVDEEIRFLLSIWSR